MRKCMFRRLLDNDARRKPNWEPFDVKSSAEMFVERKSCRKSIERAFYVAVRFIRLSRWWLGCAKGKSKWQHSIVYTEALITTEHVVVTSQKSHESEHELNEGTKAEIILFSLTWWWIVISSHSPLSLIAFSGDFVYVIRGLPNFFFALFYSTGEQKSKHDARPFSTLHTRAFGYGRWCLYGFLVVPSPRNQFCVKRTSSGARECALAATTIRT